MKAEVGTSCLSILHVPSLESKIFCSSEDDESSGLVSGSEAAFS